MKASRDHGHRELHLDYAYMGREADGQSIANSGGQVLEGSLVDHTLCTVQKYPASVDRWKACERRDRELRANFGDEVRSRGVDRQCEELSDMRIAWC